MESCPSVKNILLLDSEGKRIAVKYYSDDCPTNNAKEAFEKDVLNKTQKTNSRTEVEIAMFENNIWGNVDKKEALENLDLILLCIDKIINGRIILETDANSIAIRVASNSVDAGAPLSEQTMSQALATDLFLNDDILDQHEKNRRLG
ncbi:Coatomer subunit zeta-1 [Abeliophyllum distichum]|uniref:Coatomer subunit zeta n=1 Tax=Abeliophyllum distichum TaxID=126358 RepID=A0ABD1U1Y7_9LAMI